MANHFEAIGFKVWDEDDVEELTARIIENGQPVRVRGGEYIRWAPGAGAEVWAQFTSGWTPSLTPHFAGATELRAAIIGRVHLHDETPLEGYLQAWINPPADGALDDGDYPLVFAVPDFRALDGMRLPAAARIQLAAFAHELEVFASVDAYLASRRSEVKFAPESVIPADVLVPLALITGRVLAAERRTNPAGGAFWWMQVRTYGGEVDVVAEDALVTEPPTVGGVISGDFYLSARVRLDEPVRRKRWWHRASGR